MTLLNDMQTRFEEGVAEARTTFTEEVNNYTLLTYGLAAVYRMLGVESKDKDGMAWELGRLFHDPLAMLPLTTPVEQMAYLMDGVLRRPGASRRDELKPPFFFRAYDQESLPAAELEGRIRDMKAELKELENYQPPFFGRLARSLWEELRQARDSAASLARRAELVQALLPGVELPGAAAVQVEAADLLKKAERVEQEARAALARAEELYADMGARKARELKPLDGLRVTITNAWGGNIIKDAGRFVADWFKAFDSAALTNADIKKLTAVDGEGPRRLQVEIQTAWDKTVAQVQQDGVILGWLQTVDWKMAYIGAADRSYYVCADARQIVFIYRLTMFDQVRVIGTDSPLVFIKDGQPVAMLMCLDQKKAAKDDQIDLATAFEFVEAKSE